MAQGSGRSIAAREPNAVKRFHWTGLRLAVAVLGLASVGARAAEPNVVFIMTDQQSAAVIPRNLGHVRC